MLALTEGLIGLGLGFSAPFFNIFFDQNLKASTAQIGLIFALGSIMTAVVTLFVPIVVRYFGRVRTVTFVKLLGVPSLILLGMSHDIVWAGAFYIVTILLIGGVFVMELGSTMLQILYFKATKGKRLFRMAPLHHHFELAGQKETKVVVRFWILGGMFALLALSTLKIQ